MSHIFVAMSGGVDSSVAALLLQQAGHRISGVNLRMFHNEDLGETPDRTCCSLADAEDAGLVARRLGFPFYVFDFSRIFRETVIQDFIREYQAGRTPNPCAVCNRAVKFGALLERVRTLGADALATGHYARVERDETSGRWLLKRGLDRSKDQSYFLYMLTQDHLAHIRFPLGSLEKPRVRQLAEAHGLVNARKRDSQDICFIPEGDYGAFLESQGLVSQPGDFLDTSGRILGRHSGLERYTTGQRRGLGVSGGRPLYVVRKDLTANTVILGDEADLYTQAVWAEDFRWVSLPMQSFPLPVTAKTRYSQGEAAAMLYPEGENRVRVVFDAPQRAVTQGQSLVVYIGDAVAGGGIICQAE